MSNISQASSQVQMQAHLDTIGTSPTLKLFTAYAPPTTADPDDGTVLVEMTLPSNWATVTNGILSNSVAWSGTAIAQGSANHYRIYSSTGVCHEQGWLHNGNFEPPFMEVGDTVQLTIGNYRLSHLQVESQAT